jgi:hypothetical protein
MKKIHQFYISLLIIRLEVRVVFRPSKVEQLSCLFLYQPKKEKEAKVETPMSTQTRNR